MSDPEVRSSSGLSLAHDGWTVLLCEPDGSIRGGPLGLYQHDARVLSRHVLQLDGRAPIPIGRPTERGCRWSATLYIPRPGGQATGPRLPQDAWRVDLRRVVGPGMHEQIRVTNESMVAATTDVSLELAADFTDSLVRGEEVGPPLEPVLDAQGGLIEIRGSRQSGPALDMRGVRFRFRGLQRPRFEPDASHTGGRWRWNVQLGAREAWQATLEIEALWDGVWVGVGDRSTREALRSRWSLRRTRVDAEPVVGRAVERAADDLLSLRNWDLEPRADGRAWVPNAGVPWFTGLFGRDVLTAGWQSLMLGPEIARGALELAARTQGTREVDWTEEEPGRMIHEVRRGPLSVLGLRPQAGYYGNQTASSFFPVALTETWHWTGETSLLRRHRAAAARAIEWARRYGDLDGDGFLEYRSRSSAGLRNQAWKDSDEAIRWPDGRIVDVPIATIEEQAFHFLALERMAEVLVALDDPGDEPERLLEEAATLRNRFDAAFRLHDTGTTAAGYAIALDGGKRPVPTVASNPLHALAAGILPAESAATLADRLLQPDLFSGWGIRTLSTDHPSYNPFAYHLGAVWPVENATALIGMRRYGLDRQLDRLVDAFFSAVGKTGTDRLPEALAGLERSPDGAPIPYPEACPIQAWSASAVVQAVQAMLGIYPFAPAGVLALVRPRLPAWLPEVTIRNMRVGRATVTIRFDRNADGSASHQVLKRQGPLLVVAGPPPNAGPDLTPSEWLADLAIRHIPGRLGRALRIALGFETHGVRREGR